jgi:hypothetical protein
VEWELHFLTLHLRHGKGREVNGRGASRMRVSYNLPLMCMFLPLLSTSCACMYIETPFSYCLIVFFTASRWRNNCFSVTIDYHMPRASSTAYLLALSYLVARGDSSYIELLSPLPCEANLFHDNTIDIKVHR